MKLFYIFATWLDVVAISSVVGVLVCSVWIIPRYNIRLNQRLWAGLGGTIALIAIASGVMLVSRTLELSGSPIANLPDNLVLVVTQTQYGLIWQIRMIAVMLLVLCWITGYVSKGQGQVIAAYMGLFSMLVVIFSRSATGHAGDNGIFRVHVWIDCLHVLSASIWMGCLFTISLLVSPILLKTHCVDRTLCTTLYRRLSSMLGLTLALVILTGIYNTSRGLVSLQDLWSTPYGRILMVKIALVIGMVCIGAHNRYIKLPALVRWADTAESDPHPRNSSRPTYAMKKLPYPTSQALGCLSRAVLWESLIGVLILLVAAVLHHTMPPADFRQFGTLK